MALGTNGYGAILISPCVSNDIPSYLYTSTGYTGGAGSVLQPWSTFGTQGTTNAVLNAGWNFGYVNAPFSSPQLIVQNTTANNQIGATFGRVVSMGIRVQYTGTTMNESGMYTCYHDNSHASLAGYTLSQIQGFAEADVVAVTRKPCILSMFPVDDNEMAYPSLLIQQGTAVTQMLYPYSRDSSHWSLTANAPTGGSPVVNTHYTMGCPIAAIVANGVPGSIIHVEVVTHLEYSGFMAGPAATTSEDDPIGAAHVRAAASRMVGAKLATPGKSNWSIMYEGLKMATKAAKPYVVPALEGALAALLI